MNSHDLRKSASDLELEYNEYINTAELVEEIKNKQLYQFCQVLNQLLLDLLEMTHDYKLNE